MGQAQPFTLRRSPRARTVRLTLRPDGELVVTLPQRAPTAWAERFVDERAAWIGRHQARLAAQRARLEARPRLGEGRSVTLGGVSHAILVEAHRERRRTSIEHPDAAGAAAPPALRVLLAAGDERPLAAILEVWLRGEARAVLGRRVVVRARDLAVRPGPVSVRDQRSRWGSASRRGSLSFNWRLVLAPAAVLDYVVVHELAHLRAFGHGPRFWALVRSWVPDADRHRRWLKEHDLELRHALD